VRHDEDPAHRRHADDQEALFPDRMVDVRKRRRQRVIEDSRRFPEVDTVYLEVLFGLSDPT